VKPGLVAKLALAAIAGALLLVAVGVAPGRTPAPGRATVLWLAVESLATDGDLAPGDDVAAFRERFGTEPRGADATQDGELPVPPAARFWVRCAAAVRALAGWPGVFALQWALWLGAALLLVRAVRPKLGGSAAIAWITVALSASAAPLVALHLVPESSALLGVALAAACIWGRRSAPTAEPEQIYQGDLVERAGAWRWPAAGVGFGLAAAAAPSLVPLAAPFVAAAPGAARLLRAAAFVAGAALSFALVALVGGWPWPSLELWYDPALAGWSAFAALVGRHLGVVTLFVPLALALVAPARDEGRRWIPWAVLAALLAQVVTSPFDLAGESGAPGNPWALPLVALLAVWPASAPPRGALAGVALLGLTLVSPLLLDALGVGDRRWARPAERLRSWLPLETTERVLPDEAVLDRGSGIVLRGSEPGVYRGKDGRLRLTAARTQLWIESATPLASLRLELGDEAPAAIEVRGGTAGEVLFRPSGEIAVDVGLASPSRRHPTWRSPRGAAFYAVELVLPRAPAAPLPLDLSIARPAGEPAEAE